MWMFLPPVIGTRKLVWMSTLLFLFPLVGWGIAVQNPDTPYVTLLLLAVMAGIGGGVFSGFMPEHVVLLPQGQAGHRPGRPGGHRQLRCQRGPVRHAVDRRVRPDRRRAGVHERGHGRHEGRLVPERGMDLGALRPRRDGARLVAAAQRAGPGPRRAPADRHLQQQAHLDHDPDVHHHLRNLLRAGRLLRPPDQAALRRRRSSAPRASARRSTPSTGPWSGQPHASSRARSPTASAGPG